MRTKDAQDPTHESPGEPIAAEQGRCVWETEGRRCWLPGGMSNQIGGGRRSYCHWHFVALTSPRDVNDYHDFVRWSSYWKAYCSLENHHPVDEVWEAIQGRAPIKSDPVHCGSFACRHPRDEANGLPF